MALYIFDKYRSLRPESKNGTQQKIMFSKGANGTDKGTTPVEPLYALIDAFLSSVTLVCNSKVTTSSHPHVSVIFQAVNKNPYVVA